MRVRVRVSGFQIIKGVSDRLIYYAISNLLQFVCEIEVIC